MKCVVNYVKNLLVKIWPCLHCYIIIAYTQQIRSLYCHLLSPAFKKQFALTVSVKWQPAVIPRRDEPVVPHIPPKSLFLSSPTKPQHNILNSTQHTVLSARPASTATEFCRAVGKATVPQHHASSAISRSQEHVLSPVILLRKMCEASGFGEPLYEMYYSHTGPDGFICLTYKVSIPGVSIPFRGLVMVLLGPSSSTMLGEAQQAAAQQVLEMVFNKRLS